MLTCSNSTYGYGTLLLIFWKLYRKQGISHAHTTLVHAHKLLHIPFLTQEHCTHTHTHANYPYPWTHFSQTDTGFNTSNNHTLFHSRTHFSYIYKMNTHWVNCCYLFSQYLQPTVKELDARSVSDHLVSVMHWCWERSIHLERANMHCQGIARPI